MNWGHGIAAFLTIFILYMVYMVYQANSVTFDLESEDYYQQEIDYQDRIDALNKGMLIKRDIDFQLTGDSLRISLSRSLETDLGKGVIHFIRPNDASMDREYDMDLKREPFALAKSELAKGNYRTRIEWQTSEGEVIIEKDIQIK